MASLVDAGLSGSTGGSGNVTLSLAGAEPGDLVVVSVGGDASTNNPAMVSAGYDTEIVSDPGNLGEAAIGVFSKRMDDPPDTDVVVAGSGSGIAGTVATRYIVRAAGASGTPVVATAINGFANPASVSAIEDGVVLIFGVQTDQHNGVVATAAPSGYGSLLSVKGTNLIDATGFAAAKVVTADGTEDPGAFTWDEGASSQFQRVVTLSIEPEGVVRPEITGEAVVGGVNLQSGPFEPVSVPDDEHIETIWQYALVSAPTVWTEISRETPSAEMVAIHISGLTAVPHYFQVKHIGLIGGESMFSESLTLTPLATSGIPRPHTPTGSITQLETDLAEVTGSAFAHDEATTTKAEYHPDTNPKPYLELVDVELWDGGILLDKVTLASFDTLPAYLRDELDAGRAYDGFKLTYYDGHYKAWSLQSAFIPFTTLTNPGDVPVTPTLSLVTCGGGASGDETTVEITNSYSHPLDAPLVRHRWRVRWANGAAGRSYVLTAPDVTSLTYVLPQGGWLISVRWESASSVGGYSNEVSCTTTGRPRQPRMIEPTGAVLTTGADVDFEWEMLDAGPYTYNVKVSLDGGLSYTLAQTGAAETFTLLVGALQTGAYYVRISAINSSDVEGDASYTVVLVERRTGTPGIEISDMIDFKQFTALEPTWVKKLDTSLSWTFIADPSLENPSLGLLVNHSSTFVHKMGGLAFEEYGDQIGEVELVTEFALLGENRSWYPYRHVHMPFNRPGLGWRMDGTFGTGNAFAQYSSSGASPWYLKPANCIAPFGTPCTAPNCVRYSCFICRESGAAHIYAQNVHPTLRQSALSYGDALTNAIIGTGRITNGTYQSESQVPVTHGSGRKRGMGVSFLSVSDEECMDMRWYISRMKITPEGDTFRIRTQVQGPGIAQASFQQERVISASSVAAEGFVGLFAKYVHSSLNPNRGILFRSFAIIVPGVEELSVALGTSLVFDLGRYKREQGTLVWHQHSRVITRPAPIDGTDITYVGELNQVLQIDEDSIVEDGYFISPALNQENRSAVKTLSRVLVQYEAEDDTTVVIEGSPNGGVTWVAGFTPTAEILQTAGATQVKIAIQGMNVTGPDVRFRVSWPADYKVHIKEWRVEGVIRGDQHSHG